MTDDHIGFDGGSLTLGAVEREKNRYRNPDNAPKDAREIIAAEIEREALACQSTTHEQRADLIIEALHAAGYKTLAREPTEAMIRAADDKDPPYWNWGVMWDAAP